MTDIDTFAASAASDLDDETEALAARFITCIGTGDLDGLSDCFAPDAVIWHNDDGLEVGLDRVRRVMGWVHRHVADFRYTSVRRRAIASGYVQQHVVEGTAESGATLWMPACLVVTVSGGRIVRLDEYLDSRQSAVVSG